MKVKNTLIPTQLFSGPQDLLTKKTELLLQEHFCLNKNKIKNLNDCLCNQCKKIKSKQHEFIVWINPEKDYTIKDIQVIFEKTNFSLDENQIFFFILQKAQTLNLASANKLLKILEEPPKGYNFILHTNNINLILPTIISRCHITNFSWNNEYNKEHSITSFFYNQQLDDPINFEKELKRASLSDSQSIELINNMLDYFSRQIINFYKNKDIEIEQKLYFENDIENLKEKIKRPPQSGSSNIFWKNIYISFPRK